MIALLLLLVAAPPPPPADPVGSAGWPASVTFFDHVGADEGFEMRVWASSDPALEPGDAVLAVGGKWVVYQFQATFVLEHYRPGARVRLLVRRSGLRYFWHEIVLPPKGVAHGP